MGSYVIVMRAAPVTLFLCGLFFALPGTANADQSGYLYSYGLDESRYGDTLFSFDAYKPLGDPAEFRPYVDVFGNDDTKTAGGSIPRIYGDNYTGAAVGVQYTNNRGLRLFLQGGATATVGSVAAVPSGGDIRAGAQLYREWGAISRTGRYGNFYGSATYYSRYQDSVLYSQLESGRAIGARTHPTDVYLRGVATADTHSFYYDNYAQLTAGIRFRPFGVHGLAFALEESAGIYTRPMLLPPHVTRMYTNFGPTVSYGVNL